MKKTLKIVLVITLIISMMPLNVLANSNKMSRDVGVSSDITIGDYIQFGSYHKKAILWRVINLDTDGNPLLFAENIISYKSYDVPEGSYSNDRSRNLHGSNKWENSNIREWLNSTDKIVKWTTQPPTSNVLKETLGSPYANEQGFLNNFTSKEKSFIKPVTHKVLLTDIDKKEKTGGNEAHTSKYIKEGFSPPEALSNYDKSYYKNVTDSVFLLSIKELNDYVYMRGFETKKTATDEVKTIESNNYNRYKQDNGTYWLRTPESTYPINGRVVNSIGNVNVSANVYGWGIVPALYLNLSVATIGSGSGTTNNPYSITDKSNSKKTIEVTYNSINLNVNGNKIIADNILYEGTTYVPLRAVAEALGKRVHWIQETKTANINDKIGDTSTVKQSNRGANSKKTIEVTYNSINLNVNGNKIIADNILYEGTTYVPLRTVAEALGKEVIWIQKTNTASINDKSEKSNFDANEEGVKVFEDEKVKISYLEGSDEEVKFLVENKTNNLISVRGQTVELNGLTPNSIVVGVQAVMPDESNPDNSMSPIVGKIPPKGKGEFSMYIGLFFGHVGEVKVISGTIKITDTTNSWDSYDAKYVDIKVK